MIIKLLIIGCVVGCYMWLVSPLAIVFIVWLVSRPFEKPLVDEVIRTGGSVDAIPNPIVGRYGCAAFITWILVFGSMGIVAVGLLLAIVEGKTL